MTETTAAAETQEDPADSLDFFSGLQVKIGRALWEQGGTADRSMQYGLKVLQHVLSDPVSANESTVEIKSPRPRGIADCTVPTDMETIDEKGFFRYVTPCGGFGEGNWNISAGWKMALVPPHAMLLADLAAEYVEAKDERSRAVALGKFNDAMIGINLYPMCVDRDEMNEVRAKMGLKPLAEKSAVGSQNWAAFNSNYDDALITEMRPQIAGLRHVTAIIGEEGSDQRREYIAWYGEQLMKRINATAAEKDNELTLPQGRDLGRVICATLDKGDATLTPRAVQPGQFFLLTRLSGFARIYERSQMAKDSTEIGATEKHTFGGVTWVKVVMQRDLENPSIVEIQKLRPINREFVGNPDERDAQELVTVRDKHKRLKQVHFKGSSVRKRLKVGPFFLPASLTGWFADDERRKEMAMPETFAVASARARREPKG